MAEARLHLQVPRSEGGDPDISGVALLTDIANRPNPETTDGSPPRVGDGTRAGNRTLNLGIKSLSTLRLREDQRGSWRLKRTRINDATVSEGLLESPGQGVK